MEKRLRASLNSSPQDFLSLAVTQSLKSLKPALKTLIHTINPSSDLSSSFPISLHDSVSHSIRTFQTLPDHPPSPHSPPTKRPRRSKTRVAPDPHSNSKQDTVQNLQVLAYIAHLCVSHPKRAFSAESLLPAVGALHDNLILFESDSVLSSEIVSLCEIWWKEDLQGKEALISQSLPFLVSRSLTLKKKVDVHRAYALREAFALFDFEDQSIEDLKLLLIRCVIAPLYLKTDDGRRFVAFMFGLSGQLMKEALAMIRSQIPFGRKSMLEAYGDILFRAWKVAEGDSRDEMENGFLQVLVEGAIHGSSGAFAASIRRVLGGFISQRTTNGVEKLLFRLAEPVLFRSLLVANSNVRQNALHLLLDVFPLEDPDSTKEVKDTLLQKQFFLLERLLKDDCPDVRVVAVEGSCRILNLFWEIIPPSTITKIITKIFDEMSHDISNEVRLSTLNGIMYLLGNPQSHEILKVLLPRLGHLMFDNALSIRVAVADLLLHLRDVRHIQFNKVIELDVLLSVLVDDKPDVAKKITKLLLPSYFPSKVTPEEACNRCVALMKRSPMAGARFCKFARSEGASLKSLMQLVRVFINIILTPDQLDENQIEGLIVAAANLCHDLASDSLHKSAFVELLAGDNMRLLYSAASTAHARSSVLDMVSTISPDAAAGLIQQCAELVINCAGLAENVERQAEVRSAHKLLLSCGGFDDIFETLTRHLQRVAYRCHVKFGIEVPNQGIFSAKRKKCKSSVKVSAQGGNASKKKSPSLEEDFLTAVGIAWQVNDLLVYENAQKVLLGSETLEQAFFALKVISEVSIVQCMHSEYMDPSPVLAYTALALHTTLANFCFSDKNYGAKKDGGSSSSGSCLKTILDQTVDHLLNCTEKLFVAGDSGKSEGSPSETKQDKKKTHCRGQKHEKPQTSNSGTNNGGPVNPLRKNISSMMKMLTLVLKFLVDSATMCFISHNHGRCLKFTSTYVQHIISTIEQECTDQLQFQEGLKEIIQCLKSSFTYAAKLLNLALKITNEALPPPLEAFDLSNRLLDLIVSVELHLGPGCTGRLVTAVKPWLPDLILALASSQILKETPSERVFLTLYDHIKLQFPKWLIVLAKTELREISEENPEEGDTNSGREECPCFRKLVGTIVTFLRGSSRVLDAIGLIIMTGSAVGLRRKDFGLVLGLVHFVSLKLVGDEGKTKTWDELHLMLDSLQDIYPELEKKIEEHSEEDGAQMLITARLLLEPVWLHHTYETGRLSEREEE